jgi:3-deoxy-D-arabino-heptulosonate 7-phosphate (DAHP) synthase class II
MSGIIAIINKMHETISSMGVVINQVSDYNCPGRNEMNKRWNELERMMKELNKPPVIITAGMVNDLRAKTGEGVIACKKALVASNGDHDKATEYLRNMGNI